MIDFKLSLHAALFAGSAVKGEIAKRQGQSWTVKHNARTHCKTPFTPSEIESEILIALKMIFISSQSDLRLKMDTKVTFRAKSFFVFALAKSG